MSNMSYCRFRNTLTDLRDCAENMDKCEGDEEKARLKMIAVCVNIACNHGHEIRKAVEEV